MISINPNNKILNLPNMLTMARIAAIPLLAMLLLYPSRSTGFWAAIVFALASITDWLDGYLARRMGIVTVFGKFLDPIADKLIVMAALIMILPFNRVPGWMVLVAPLLEATLWPLATVLLLMPQRRAPDPDAHRPL